jgi:hypothetical protein
VASISLNVTKARMMANIDLDRPLASQDAREHGNALLGER